MSPKDETVAGAMIREIGTLSIALGELEGRATRLLCDAFLPHTRAERIHGREPFGRQLHVLRIVAESETFPERLRAATLELVEVMLDINRRRADYVHAMLLIEAGEDPEVESERIVSVRRSRKDGRARVRPITPAEVREYAGEVDEASVRVQRLSIELHEEFYDALAPFLPGG